MRTDWGSVPAWVQLVGVLVAVLAYTVGRRDAQRAHAAKVYALVVSYRHGDLEREGKPLHTTVTIDNGSDLPIFDVGLSLRGWGQRRRFWRIRRRRNWWTVEQVTGVSSRSYRRPVRTALTSSPVWEQGTQATRSRHR